MNIYNYMTIDKFSAKGVTNFHDDLNLLYYEANSYQIRTLRDCQNRTSQENVPV